MLNITKKPQAKKCNPQTFVNNPDKMVSRFSPTSFILISLIYIFVFVGGLNAQIEFANAFPGVEFEEPVYFGVFPGKAQAYVVLEQHTGNVVLVYQEDNNWVRSSFLSIEVHQNIEMGLLGIAFHPDFQSNRRYFISYDPPGDFANILEERLADETLLKDSGEEGVEVINITDKYSNHNGGTIAFGPDGYLYFGTGDGGSMEADPDGNAQNKEVLLGKMLRIDVDNKEGGLNYGIPSENPFATGGGRGEIFAYGLRNPFKWSFDPLNGDLWVGDVGYLTMEEVDIVTLGGNYGWKDMEATLGTNTGSMILPVFSYERSEGTAVIGGVVYRADQASSYYGTYFAADFYSKNLWALEKNGTDNVTATKIGTTPTGISGFGYDELGRIYLCGHADGTIYRMESPDLAGATAVNPMLQASSGYQRVIYGRPGAALGISAFSRANDYEAYSLEGKLLFTLEKISPVIPADTELGMYILKNSTKNMSHYLWVH